MDPYNVTHLWEHFGGGVHALADGDDPLRVRLVPVIRQVMTRFSNPEGFDPILRPIWIAIRNACSTHDDTVNGSIHASINAMDDRDLRWLVRAFVDMATWVERNIPVALADAVLRENDIPMRFRAN